MTLSQCLPSLLHTQDDGDDDDYHVDETLYDYSVVANRLLIYYYYSDFLSHYTSLYCYFL
jgi:hypothetical protein